MKHWITCEQGKRGTGLFSNAEHIHPFYQSNKKREDYTSSLFVGISYLMSNVLGPGFHDWSL